MLTLLAKATSVASSVRLLTVVSNENASVATEMAAVAELRTIDKPFSPQSSNFASVDSHDLLISEVKPDDLKTDHGSDFAVWNRNKIAVGVHDELFDRLWQAAKPVKTK